MSTSSQNPSPDSPKSAREELFRRLAGAFIDESRADALLDAYRAEVERKVRTEIAADFVRQGKASNTLTWGQAHEIALNGLCACSGGIKPCDMGGTS